MRPEIIAEVREWLERAADDLREAEHDLTANPPLLRGAAFHCQQAAEKTLKAFLTAQEQTFRKTHDLDELGTAVVARDRSLTDAVDRATELTPYAWRFRYPGAPADPTVAEARDALAVARELYDLVTASLPDAAAL